jgi:serine/threonine-protein kinase HipA
MQIASQVYNIPTAANGLCFFQNDEPAYITRRFDPMEENSEKKILLL